MSVDQPKILSNTRCEKLPRKMSKYFYTRTNQTLQSEYHCPYLPIFFQWQNSYLTPSVLFSSIAASVVNGLMAIITTASNGLVIISILKRKSFRVNSFMLLLVSLSITGKAEFWFLCQNYLQQSELN